MRADREYRRVGFTVDFLEPWFFGDGGGCVLVQRSIVTGQVELFVNVDFLIAQDYTQGSGMVLTQP